MHLADDLRGTIVHNPRSNMNNAVGYARPGRRPNPVVLGTDGIGADMLDEFRLAYVRQREDDVTASPRSRGRGSATAGTSSPQRGRSVRVVLRDDGSVAPRVHDRRARARSRVDGESCWRDGAPTRVDAAEIRARAAEQARRLFSRLLMTMR